MRMRVLFPTAVLGAATLMVFAACSDRIEPTGVPQAAITVPPTVPPGPPRDAGKPATGISFVDGGGNLPAGGTALHRVQVTDKKGNPLAGRLVQWSSTSGGSFSPVFGQTDASGYAATQFTGGTVAGTAHVVTATTSERTASVTTTVVAAEAYSMLEYAGDGGTEKVGAVRTISVIIKDRYGNPVPNYNVLFSTPVGGGSVTPASALTNSAGIASAQWTIGPIANDFQLATAMPDNGGAPMFGAPATFQIEAEPGPPASIVINPSTDSVDGYADNTSYFTAIVRDAYDNVIDPTTVTVQWSSSNPSLVLVFGNGVATVMQNVCANTPVTITATSGAATGQATLVLLQVPCE